MKNWDYEKPKFECDEINGDLLIYAPWSGHRNFIYDFVKYYNPEKFVELGSHYGCSSFAILQAIKDFGLDTEFYAIDTWEGDSLTVYGEKEHVYEAYKKVNDIYFNEQKSYMIRMTFDDAAKKFSNHSVNVIHIDGSHEYRDVKHDYQTWISKMSENGIMIFHDISEDKVLGNTMGSHIFWEELKKEQPYTCEFDFSFGLGIVFLSENTYKDFLNKVDIQKYQRINNEMDVNYKDVIRKYHFQLMDKDKWIESLQKDKKCLEEDNKRLLHEVENVKKDYKKNDLKIEKAYEKDSIEKEQYIKELEQMIQECNRDADKRLEQTNAIWEKELEKVKHDYEFTIREKDQYISELEQKIVSYEK